MKDPWIMRHLFWVQPAGALVLATPIAWYEATHPRPPMPCERFANVPMKDVPARCVRYFQEQR